MKVNYINLKIIGISKSVTVKILYVRNLMLSTTEETIKEIFTKACGSDAIERVKKIRDYAFVHFREREDALAAMNSLNNTALEGSMVEVVLAKPVDKNEYMRYTRGKNSIPQAYGYGVTLQQPTIYSGQVFAQPGGRGFPTRTAVGIRGAMRGRGRGAAGSRGAGVRANFLQNLGRGTYSRYCSPEILDDLCQKNGWGSPVYQLHSTITRDGTGELQLFLFKVSLPALSPAPFQPNKLCKTVEEAKGFAADFVLSYLGVNFEGSDVPVVLNPYQRGPALPVANGLPRSDITYASSIPVATSASYVVASGKMPPLPAQMAIPAEYAYEINHPAAYTTAQPQLQY